MPRYYAEKILEKHGADKLLFGTDSPWHTPEAELSLLGTLNLSESDRAKILFENAKRLLHLDATK